MNRFSRLEDNIRFFCFFQQKYYDRFSCIKSLGMDGHEFFTQVELKQVNLS
jgi:hypothetical protein